MQIKALLGEAVGVLEVLAVVLEVLKVDLVVVLEVLEVLEEVLAVVLEVLEVVVSSPLLTHSFSTLAISFPRRLLSLFSTSILLLFLPSASFFLFSFL